MSDIKRTGGKESVDALSSPEALFYIIQMLESYPSTSHLNLFHELSEKESDNPGIEYLVWFKASDTFDNLVKNKERVEILKKIIDRCSPEEQEALMYVSGRNIL